MMLLEYAKHKDLMTNHLITDGFEQRFKKASFKDQYDAMAWLFVNKTEPEHQYWLMEKATQMTKSAGRTNMVDFFIKNFSYGEVQEMRTSIWAIMK